MVAPHNEVMIWAAAIVLANPIVIGHRGASAIRPEHTIEAYKAAIEAGADYIEPDLVITKDGILVARHENEISGTTNVGDRPEFAGRKKTKTIDGQEVTGWFTEDFTLAELKTLRAKERLPQLRPGNTEYDGRFEIPTFSEVVALAKAQKRTVGVYPETKHPSYFRSIGLPLEPPLIDVLKRYGWDKKNSPVFIQSFEVGNLWALNRQIDVPLIQLVDSTGKPADLALIEDERTYRDLLTSDGLRTIAGYADGIGVNKDLIIPRNADGTLGKPTTLVADAHRLKLKVHAWTFRDEDYFLPTNLKGQPQEELSAFLATGLDGVFMDNPATGVSLLAKRR
jgi:glycerophosphoryl diester phosphodiesterase